MTAPAFTQGPWYVRDDDPSSLEVRRDDEDCRLICEFPYGTEKPEDQANAHLIAAAPELYEALADMLAGWRYIREEHGDFYGVGCNRCERLAQAALAKARGEKT